MEGIRGGAGARERGWDQREDAGYQWLVGIDELPRRLPRTPVGDSVHLTAFLKGEKNKRGEDE
jgi:hypothetical protein